jgi:hypothetical protein
MRPLADISQWVPLRLLRSTVAVTIAKTDVATVMRAIMRAVARGAVGAVPNGRAMVADRSRPTRPTLPALFPILATSGRQWCRRFQGDRQHEH